MSITINNRYQFNSLDSQIKSGQNGDCYKATDTQTNKQVLLKLVNIETAEVFA